ncbi:MAG: site-specific DNA-methyltransferase [Actinobacteria bacterium]|nr:site-specific DNA-methyltransferase [Actinomycetota bacterium]
MSPDNDVYPQTPRYRLYYEDECVTLYCGRWEDVLPTLARFDLIFTSPPYNLGASPWPHLGHWKPGDGSGGKSKWRNGSDGSGGVQYVEHEDTMPWDEYVLWQRRSLRAMWEHLTQRGAIFYNHKPRVIGGRCWLPLELNPDLPLRQIVTWARAGGMNFNPTAYVPTYEWLMIFARDEFRLASKAVSGIGDLWREAQEPNEHPAPFPVGLPARAIESTAPALVLDPYAGSGSTLIAAKAAGIRAIGIEKSDEYCEMAVRRLAQGSLFEVSA